MSSKTVYIVGAGASSEAGLPIGNKFIKKITQLLNIEHDITGRLKSGDGTIAQALRNHVASPEGRPGDIGPYLQGAHHIRKALSQAISIDNFIDQHRGNEKIAVCGKLAIAKVILDEENGSRL